MMGLEPTTFCMARSRQRTEGDQVCATASVMVAEISLCWIWSFPTPSPEPIYLGRSPKSSQFGIAAHDMQGAPRHRPARPAQLDDIVTITTPTTTITTPMARPGVSFSERNSADRISVTAG
jgi:hypothetical protein